MQKQNGGFTLIELVVVIVVLGILAATAVPRFVNLTANAESAACQGVVGALMSSAVMQVANNSGGAVLRATVIANTDVSGSPAPSVTAGGAGIINVTVGGASCATPNLLTAGLTSD